MAKKATTKPAEPPKISADTPEIRNGLILRPSLVNSSDIETWRTAVNMAKYGDRVKLYDLYDNILADGDLADAVDKRINAITNAELTFIRDGKAVDEITELIDTPEFELLIREILLSKAWGKSVIEVMFDPRFDVFSYPRKHIKIKDLDKRLADHKKFIAAREYDVAGYDYTQDNRFIECGDDYDLGFLFKAAIYVIYKRGGFGDWAQFAEIFGMPFVIGKYHAYDSQTRDELFKALEGLGGHPIAAIPDEADIDLKPGATSAGSSIYSNLIQACKEGILVSVLGNTMTTLNGSSRSQSEVHQESEEKINHADRRYVQRILNRYLLPLLIARGYDAAGGFFSFPDAGENRSVAERIETALQIKSAGIAVPDDYFYETSGIPKPEDGDDGDGDTGNGEQRSNAAKTPLKQESNNADTEVEVSTLDLTDLEPEHRALLQRLRDFFSGAPKAMIGAIRQTRRFIAGLTTSTITLADDDGTTSVDIDVAKLFNQALRDIYNNASNGQKQPNIQTQLFRITDDALQAGIKQTFAKAGVEFGQKNEAFIDQFRFNAAVFAAFKNHKQTDEIVSLLTDEQGSLLSFAKFKKAALQVSKDYNENWLRTEYNTAVASARQATNWRKYQETKHLYPNLEYIRTRSAEPRNVHLEWVGTVRRIEDKWWNTHYPPSAWNCKCSVKQTDKPITDLPEETDDVNPVFANNPGKSAEFVKLSQTSYVKGMCPYLENCARKNGSPKNQKLADGDPDNQAKQAHHPYMAACENCMFAKTYIKEIKRIEDNAAMYERLKADPNYEDVEFNPNTGGLRATHIGHKFEKTIGAFDVAQGVYEHNAQDVLYAYGRQVLLQSEHGEFGEPTPDGVLDGITFDIKGIEGHSWQSIRGKISTADKQTAKIVVFYYYDDSYFSMLNLVDGWAKYVSDHSPKLKHSIEAVYYIRGSRLFRFK
jgi:hypothetical protein